MPIDIESIIDTVATEYGVGGFDTSTIYGQFALEVAKRAVVLAIQECIDKTSEPMDQYTMHQIMEEIKRD